MLLLNLFRLNRFPLLSLSSESNQSNSASELSSPVPKSCHVTVPEQTQSVSEQLSSSVHPMQTSSKSGIVKPKLHPTLLFTTAEPSTVKQALISPPWRQAMQADFDALMENKTLTLTSLPSGKAAIDCKWVFRIKENPDGTLNRYRSRLVAKGFHLKFGCDYSETFSPVIEL